MKIYQLFMLFVERDVNMSEKDLKFNHVSVLLNECIENLHITPNGIYVDGTLGGAGHSFEIAKRLSKGRKTNRNR